VFILRIIGILSVIAIGAGILAFLFTRDRRYLGFSWRVAKYSLVLALIILSLFFLERTLVPIL